ncbi:HNH endonuclease [Corynebacterium provencense]|uniref:HNH endonuclease n=1 Tax=Corynebacterium provencense TaxID=1737425 RepID=UPI0021C38936|nr:HNH endonuclease [Corynebacterium provencense]
MIPTVCVGPPQQIHHRQMRSQGGEHTIENGIFLCHACHAWVHAHPKWAYRAELLVHGWEEPRFPPVFYRGRMTQREE